MKLTLLVLVAALLSPLIGQEAKIIIIEKPDAQRLKRAYEKYKEAQAEWNAAKASVAKEYTYEKGKTMEGWDKVQFSADFRAIVPDNSLYATTAYRGSCWGSGLTLTNATTSTPAVGTVGTVNLGDSDFAVAQDLTVKEKR